MTGSRYVYPEGVSEMSGISVRVVRKMLTVSRRRTEAGGQLTATHLPLPEDYVRRTVFNGHHQVTVLSPRWRRTVIKAWLAGRPGKGRAGIARKSDAA
jgi:hypothetical protein